MIGGLTIIGLFIVIFFGFDTGDPLERDATLRVLRCQYGYDLINGQCIDRNECIGNLYQACLLNGLENENRLQVEAVNCIMSADKPNLATEV